MPALERFNKPYYLWRPGQALRRAGQILGSAPVREVEQVTLPWGLGIRIRPEEVVGERLLRRGVYDLALTETVHRLLDPGEVAVDVGANIGYVSGLAAVCVGPAGRVIAFEPHPSVFEELRVNCDAWQRDSRTAPLDIRRVALSAERGSAVLAGPATFARNRGSASVGQCPEAGTNFGEVPTERLDDALAGVGAVGLLKLDVEGHEPAVLAGAEASLSSGAIRDIVFEEHRRRYPTDVTRILSDHGYTLLALGHGLLRPTATPGGGKLRVPHGEELNYLATREPERALRRLRQSGWRSLRRRRTG